MNGTHRLGCALDATAVPSLTEPRADRCVVANCKEKEGTACRDQHDEQNPLGKLNPKPASGSFRGSTRCPAITVSSPISPYISLTAISGTVAIAGRCRA